jgi:hypothetical protein
MRNDEKTEMANFGLFSANEKRKFVFLGNDKG